MSPLTALRARRWPEEPEHGAVIVLFAIMLVVILLFAALAIDLGNLEQNHQVAQDATDSAAVTGAAFLGSTDFASGSLSEPAVVTDVEDNVIENSPNYPGLTAGSALWDTCTQAIPSGWNAPADSTGHVQNCISFNSSSTSAHVIQVAIPPQLIKYWFGKVKGITGQTISAVSTAELPPGGGTAPCGLCALSAQGASLQNGNITLGGNSVYVDGPLGCNPQGSIDVTGTGAAIDVAAGGSACKKGTFSPTPNWSASVISDPLAGLPNAPNYSGLTQKSDCNSGTALPGIYDNIGSCTLSPGLYVVTGTLGGNGNTSVTGSGVTVFFTCGTASAPVACSSSGEAGGGVEAGGNGSINLSACSSSPCTGGATAGMLIWYDRNDTSALDFHGNGSLSMIGTIYAKSATLDLKGTPSGVSGGCGTNTQICSEVVVNTFSFSGQSSIALSYNSNQNVVLGAGTPELCTRAPSNNCGA
jgi:hypothetical protein